MAGGAFFTEVNISIVGGQKQGLRRDNFCAAAGKKVCRKLRQTWEWPRKTD
jgi:hypothetical protein